MASLTPNNAPRPVPIMPPTSSSDSGYKIAVRFGDQVLQAGFTSVPNLVLNHYAELGISPAEMMFTIHMWQYRWTERDPYPSLTTIAEKMDVSWRQAHRYANSLKDKGFLVIRSRQAPGRGQVTSEYDFEPLIQAVLKLDTASSTSIATSIPTSGNEAETTSGETPLSSMSGGGMTEVSVGPLTRVSDEEYKEQKDPPQENKDANPSNIRRAQSLREEQGEEEKEPTIRAAYEYGQSTAKQGKAGRGEGFSSLGGILARSSLKLPPRPYGEERQVIMDYVAKFAKEFNDHASLKVSTTRAYNLFRRSGMPLGGFIGRMYEAHAITKESAAPTVPPAHRRRNLAEGEGTQRGRPPKNRMAYWFSVLEDRLGLRPEKRSRGAGVRGQDQRSKDVQKSS